MVRKIQNGEYLKRVDNMTAVERQEYMSRVGDWLTISGQSLTNKGETFEAQLQNVLQVSIRWNDQECQAFEEGAVLLSALVGVADTKLPELLYAISAKRAIKRMFQLLWEAEEQPQPQPLPLVEGSGYTQPSQSVRMQAGAAKEALLFADDDTIGGKTAGHTGGKTADHTGGETAGQTVGHSEGAVAVNQAAIPVRPKHFDQYAHLLPQKTQEHIAKYGPLMREMDEAREKLNLLMNDQTASAADREAWAKKVAAIDKEIGNIKKEADREWAKLAKEGRVVVDELGMARVLSSPESPTPDPIPADAPTRSLSPEGAGSATAEDSPSGAGAYLLSRSTGGETCASGSSTPVAAMALRVRNV